MRDLSRRVGLDRNVSGTKPSVLHLDQSYHLRSEEWFFTVELE